MNTAIAIVSGGLDSVTLAYHLADRGYALHLVSFDYGQRHKRELDYAATCAQRLHAKHSIIDIRGIGEHLKGSALTDSIAVPHGHYAEESMRITVVPNRNAIMLAAAFGVAVSDGAELVATAVHAGDHFIYPDCRPAFITAFDSMQRLAVEGFGHPDLHLEAPFVHIGKHHIVSIGATLGVPYTETWSCYEGGDMHCGACGTCVERKEAFSLAGVSDPTIYQR